MKAAIVPEYDTLLQDEILHWDGEYKGTKSRNVDRIGYHHLQKHFDQNGDSITTIDRTSYDEVDVCLFVDSSLNYVRDAVQSEDTPALVYIMREAPVVNGFNSQASLLRWSPIFDRIFTWNDTLAAQNELFVHYDWPQYRRLERVGALPFEERDLLTIVSSRKFATHPDELYSAREDIIEFYDERHPNQFSLYGRYWNRRPRMIHDLYKAGTIPRARYDVYRGPIDLKEKVDVYHRHKFALCFENMTEINGWITEKLFDCVRAGTVPVYWGADNIEEYVPKDVFVDYREYGSPVALHDRLSSIERKEYREFLAAGKEWIQNQTGPFSPEHFAETIYKNTRGLERNRPRWIPSDVRNRLEYEGRAEALISDHESYSLREYFQEYLKLFIRDPKTLVSKPAVTYYAGKKIVPVLPDLE